LMLPLDYGRSVLHNIKRPGAGDINITEFFPSIFVNIRQLNNYSTLELMDSWDLDLTQLSKVGSSGKSGSFFLMSKCKQFFLKSIDVHEKETLQAMVSDYHQHLIKYPSSLLMKILGLFKLCDGVHIHYFIMMNNFLQLDVSIDEKYDLKGSTKDREASSGEKVKSSPVLLDLDFSAVQRKIHLGDLKQPFLDQLALDSLLLSRYNVMDYSLLIGIHTKKEKKHPKSDEIVMNSSLGKNVMQIAAHKVDEIYFIGIIDCLTPYNWKKVVAHTAKSTQWSSDELSTVNAQFYSERFIKYVQSICE